jgi:FKBP-type peptidyl-prolyl cis-trans isomerase SlyD
MTIEKEKVVSVSYELKADNAEENVIETVGKDNPLTFLYGVGNMLEQFEVNLAGLDKGEGFEFKLSVDEAYGQPRPEMVVDVPKQAFEVEGKVQEDLLQKGKQIPMQDKEGNRLNGIVVDVSDQAVKVDFNHPLAGEALKFKGEVVDIREATQEELQNKQAQNNTGQ